MFAGDSSLPKYIRATGSTTKKNKTASHGKPTSTPMANNNCGNNANTYPAFLMFLLPIDIFSPLTRWHRDQYRLFEYSYSLGVSDSLFYFINVEFFFNRVEFLVNSSKLYIVDSRYLASNFPLAR